MPSLDWLYQSVLNWVNLKSNLFQGEVLSWVHSLGVIMLIVFALDWAVQAATGSHGFVSLRTMMHLVVTYLIVLFLIANYNTTIPWVGSSVQSLLPDFGRQITKMISDQSMNDVFQAMNNHLKEIKPPDSLMSTDMVWYLVLVFLIWVAEGVLFLLSNVGIVMIGIGGVLGVLSIPWLLLPGNTLFWDWLEYMLSWSMFQVIGAALVWVWSHAFLAFFSQFGSSLNLHDLVKIKEFLILNLAFWWTSKRSYGIAQALYGKAVGHAAGWAEHLGSYV